MWGSARDAQRSFGPTERVTDRRVVIWAFVAIILASELQAFVGLGVCGTERLRGVPNSCPDLAQNIHANRESLIAGVLGLLAGFSATTGGGP
jgi:hypothetical protein